MSSLAALHAFATLAMTGLIWFVQVVHYPLFRFAAIGDFRGFARAHQTRTTAVVAPLMLVELATATALALGLAPLGAPVERAGALLGLGLLAAIWLSTALVQVPLHRRLERGFDTAALHSLVKSNWLRTVAWSVRSVIAVGLLAP